MSQGFVTYQPVFLDLNGRSVVLVGGGAVAVEKLQVLLESGAAITVVSPEPSPPVEVWAAEARLTLLRRPFVDSDVDAAFAVIAATDDPVLNAHIFELGEGRHKLTNSVDDPTHCNFIMAAAAKCGPVQVAVSSAGCSPALAQRIRDRIVSEILEPSTGELAEWLGTWRPAVKLAIPSFQARKTLWESVLCSDIPDLLATEGRQAADEAMEAFIREAA